MKDNGFEILSQISDMRMKVRGKTLEELFRNALSGMAFFWKPDILPQASAGRSLSSLARRGLSALRSVRTTRRPIKIEAPDLTALLIEFLSEVIAQADILNTVFVDVSFKKFGENFLEGELRGVKVDGFEKDIKAVSYQEVNIKKNPETGMYETTLVFDI